MPLVEHKSIFLEYWIVDAAQRKAFSAEGGQQQQHALRYANEAGTASFLIP